MTIMQRHEGGDLVEIGGGELVDLRNQSSALEAITRAEVDIQIATAKRFPRSIDRFMREAKSMVSVDADLAAQCTYVLPARKKGDDDIIGPSVRLAEIVSVCWGNLRVAGRITDDDGKFITAQGVAIDLERNVGYYVEVRKGVTYSPNAKYNPGGRFSDDMIKTICNATIAVATRNATFKVVPRAFVNVIWDTARQVASGGMATLPDRTSKAVRYFTGKGVVETAIWDKLGISGPSDMTLDLLEKLNGFKVAVSEGHTTLSDIFAPPPDPVVVQPPPAGEPGKSRSDSLLSKLKTQREPGED